MELYVIIIDICILRQIKLHSECLYKNGIIQ